MLNLKPLYTCKVYLNTRLTVVLQSSFARIIKLDTTEKNEIVLTEIIINKTTINA